MERIQSLDFDHPIFQSYTGGTLVDKGEILLNKTLLDIYIKKLDDYEQNENMFATNNSMFKNTNGKVKTIKIHNKTQKK